MNLRSGRQIGSHKTVVDEIRERLRTPKKPRIKLSCFWNQLPDDICLWILDFLGKTKHLCRVNHAFQHYEHILYARNPIAESCRECTSSQITWLRQERYFTPRRDPASFNYASIQALQLIGGFCSNLREFWPLTDHLRYLEMKRLFDMEDVQAAFLSDCKQLVYLKCETFPNIYAIIANSSFVHTLRALSLVNKGNQQPMDPLARCDHLEYFQLDAYDALNVSFLSQSPNLQWVWLPLKQALVCPTLQRMTCSSIPDNLFPHLTHLYWDVPAVSNEDFRTYCHRIKTQFPQLRYLYVVSRRFELRHKQCNMLRTTIHALKQLRTVTLPFIFFPHNHVLQFQYTWPSGGRNEDVLGLHLGLLEQGHVRLLLGGERVC